MSVVGLVLWMILSQLSSSRTQPDAMTSNPSTQHWMQLHNLCQRSGWQLDRQTWALNEVANEDWVARVTGNVTAVNLIF